MVESNVQPVEGLEVSPPGQQHMTVNPHRHFGLLERRISKNNYEISRRGGQNLSKVHIQIQSPYDSHTKTTVHIPMTYQTNTLFRLLQLLIETILKQEDIPFSLSKVNVKKLPKKIFSNCEFVRLQRWKIFIIVSLKNQYNV